jgi:hypothetical protein
MTLGARGRALLLAVALVAMTAGPATVARADVTAAGCGSRAVVVVEPGPGAVTICFDGSISGLDALQLAVGAGNVTTYGFAGQGAAVCAINGVGNPADQSSCLVGPGSQYWAYYRAAPGAGGWTFSRGGASATTVTDGSVEGWRYGTGGAPGFVSFCAVAGCAPPPTDPPPATQAVPPATSAPAAGPSTPAGGATTPTTAASKDSGKAKGDGGTGDSGTAATADGKGDKDTKDGGTTTTGKSGTKTGDRRDDSDTVEVAAGGTGGGSDGGSPTGVIVAVAVVAVAVAAGLVIRRRRGGPAPG